MAGVVTAVNGELKTPPELVNQDPYGRGWLLKLKVTDAANLAALLDAAGYEQHCAARKH